jgi:hypothetical protein
MQSGPIERKSCTDKPGEPDTSVCGPRPTGSKQVEWVKFAGEGVEERTVRTVEHLADVLAGDARSHPYCGDIIGAATSVAAYGVIRSGA